MEHSLKKSINQDLLYMYQIPETEIFLSPLPIVSNTVGDYTRGSNNYVQETILKLHHEPDRIMNNTLKMDLTCPTFE